MKLIRFLVVIGFLAICASAVRADGVDPIVRVTGTCTSSSCDAYLIGPGQSSVNFMETITCAAGATDGTGCTATETIINESGNTLNSFDLTLTSPGLTFSCESTFTYTCTPLGGGVFAITLGAGSTGFCSTDSNDIGGTGPSSFFLMPDTPTDTDDFCSTIQIGLQGTSTETVTELNGAVVSGTVNAPEPSSALLLLFGFAAALGVLKFRLA